MPNPRRLIFEPGTKFNKLTVIERADDLIVGKARSHRTAYKCRCDCGNEVVVEAAKMKNGQTKSCGCLHPGGQKGLKSLVGKQYGKLTVIERGPDRIDSSGRHRSRWWCRCSCEAQTMVLVNTDCLVGGFTKTCGCSRDDNGLKRRITNRYEFRDDFVIGYTQKGRPFFVSIEDHDLIKEYCWVESHGYVVTRGRDGKIIRLHRFIMDAPPGDFVDHINHDCFDNRRCNLRIVDPLKSLWNRGIREDNQCGVKGVYMADGKWIARITVYKKEITLGRFDTLEEAKAAREAAEIHYFGDLSYEKSIAAVPRIEGIPWKEPIERYATSSAADAADDPVADAAAIDPVADAAVDVAADPDATAPSPT